MIHCPLLFLLILILITTTLLTARFTWSCAITGIALVESTGTGINDLAILNKPIYLLLQMIAASFAFAKDVPNYTINNHIQSACIICIKAVVLVHNIGKPLYEDFP